MILITGATGNIGRQVMHALLAAHEPVRVVGRDIPRLQRLDPRVQVAHGDFDDPASFARALARVDRVFLMSPSTDLEPFAALVDALVRAGRPRVVFLSSLFAEAPDLAVGRLHLDKEAILRAAGLVATSVRPSGLMSNAFQWIPSIRADGAVYNPMGAGRLAPVAPADVGAVAAAVLTSVHTGDDVLEVTGGTLTTVAEQVRTLSGVLGQPLRCIDVPVEAAFDGLRQAGMPAPTARAVAESFDAVAHDRAMRVTDTVLRITGRVPTTFDRWARENATRFRQTSHAWTLPSSGESRP